MMNMREGGPDEGEKLICLVKVALQIQVLERSGSKSRLLRVFASFWPSRDVTQRPWCSFALNWENCWETNPTQYISLTGWITVRFLNSTSV
jgi:hypothetical protein